MARKTRDRLLGMQAVAIVWSWLFNSRVYGKEVGSSAKIWFPSG